MDIAYNTAVLDGNGPGTDFNCLPRHETDIIE